MTPTMTVDGIRVMTDAAEVARQLEKDSVIAFDTETTGLSPFKDNIAIIQLYGDDTGTLGIVRTPNGVVPTPIKDLLETSGALLVGHNVVNFDLAFLRTHHVKWENATWYDTLVGETVITSSGRRHVSVSLRNSVRRRLGLQIDKNIEHGGWDAEELPAEKVEYAARDVISLPGLYRAQVAIAKETEQFDALEMEMRLMPYVSELYQNGLPVRRDVFTEFVSAKEVEAEALLGEIHAELGQINLNSPLQIRNAIKRIYGVTLQSTRHEFLVDAYADNAYEPAWGAIGKLLEYRKPAQIVKTYGGSWANDYIVNDRVHTRFWQCSADTSRFTASDPNMQQWPKIMRGVIGNVDGLTIVSGDYSQIEVRIAAEIAGDSTLMRLLSTSDVHTSIAAKLYKVDEGEVTQAQRKNAKAVTFALLYDGTPRTLLRYSRTLGCDLTYRECQDLDSAFFKEFIGLREMRKKAWRRVSSPGPVIVRLPNGLRRILVGESKTASRILNTMVQGAAAVGIKYGMLEAGMRGLFKYMGAQVHDELIAAVPRDEAGDFARELESSMIAGMQRLISIARVEVKLGDRWQV